MARMQRHRERGRQRRSWNPVSLPLMVCFLALLSCQTFIFATAHNEPGVEVRAVKGKQVAIPCEASDPEAGDGSEVLFILFSILTQQGSARIYRVNNLGSGKVTHWAARGYESRALVDWEPSQSSAHLLLEGSKLEDEGFYACHVKRSSSLIMTSTASLTVFAPPTSLKIFNTQSPDTELEGRIGPYQIDQNVTLSCTVTGGHPQPKVTWFEGSHSLQDSQVIESDHSATRSIVSLGPMKRQDLNKNLTCRATNSDLYEDLTSSVYIDLTFPPRSVRIEGEEDGHLKVREGVKEKIVCQVDEGKPLPTVSFRLNQTLLPSSSSIEHGERDMEATTSTTHLVPSLEQDGSLLTCLAHTQPFQPVLSSVRLSVLFAPKVTLTYEDNVTSKAVKEGDEVRLECRVNAKPDVKAVTWTLNNKSLRHNADEGVVTKGFHLLLQSVNKFSSGKYRCTATNSEGQGISHPLYLKVRAKPEAVTSCSVSPNKAVQQGKTVSLSVQCVSKADGDLSKIFILEVKRAGSDKPEKRLYQHKPSFVVKGLREGSYQLNITASNDLGESPPYILNHTIHTLKSTSTVTLPHSPTSTHSISLSPSLAPSSKLSLTSLTSTATSAASAISPTPSLFSFSLSTSFSSPISQYAPNSFNFRTPPPPSSSHSFLPSHSPGSEVSRSPWAVFVLVVVTLVALGHVVCLLPKLLVAFFVYKLEKRPAQRQRHHSSPRYARRRNRNSINRDMLRAHRLSDPPMPLPTITISPPASGPSSAFSSRKGSMAMDEPEGLSLVATRAPRASVDELETSSLCPSLQNESLDAYSLQDECQQTDTPRNGTLPRAKPQNGCAKNEQYLNSTFQDAFLHYNFIEKENLKRDLNKRPRYRPSTPNFLSVGTPVRRSHSKDRLNKA